MNFKLKNISLIIILISGMIIIFGCPKPRQYSEIPEIKFKQVILYDTVDAISSIKRYKLLFGLIDGDGDVGLKVDDSIGYNIDTIYLSNFLASLYEIKNGDTIMVDSLNNYCYKIPNEIMPFGQNKTLIADVFIDYSFSYDRHGNLPYDSIMFDFFIVDTMLNKSNIIKTPVLSLKKNGKFPELNEE